MASNVLFTTLGLCGARFRAALQAGNADVMKEAAASMLQVPTGDIRRKGISCTGHHTVECCSLFVQSNWRSAAARKRAAALKAERLALQEESCARKLQAVWRAKRARQEV